MNEIRAIVFDWWATLWCPNNQIVPAVPPMLRDIKQRGIQMAVLSNTNKPGDASVIRRELDKAGVLPLFEVVVASADIGAHKPDPHIFYVVGRFLQCQPNAVLMIGDSEIADGGARQVGWRFLQVQPFSADNWAKTFVADVF